MLAIPQWAAASSREPEHALLPLRCFSQAFCLSSKKCDQYTHQQSARVPLSWHFLLLINILWTMKDWKSQFFVFFQQSFLCSPPIGLSALSEAGFAISQLPEGKSNNVNSYHKEYPLVSGQGICPCSQNDFIHSTERSSCSKCPSTTCPVPRGPTTELYLWIYTGQWSLRNNKILIYFLPRFNPKLLAPLKFHNL